MASMAKTSLRAEGRMQSLVGCALGCVLLPPHLGTWDLPSQIFLWAPSTLQQLSEKRQGINPAFYHTSSL